MKNILLCLIFAVLISFAVPAQAGEYQCDIRSTRAAGCEPYYEMKHTCAFPGELNEVRTAELVDGKATYPEFCTTCGTESGIPKKCQAGRISTFISTQESDDTSEPLKAVTESIATIQVNSILQNAYQGFKIAVGKAWEWFKVASRGESFEIESMSTPVAGVRG